MRRNVSSFCVEPIVVRLLTDDELLDRDPDFKKEEWQKLHDTDQLEISGILHVNKGIYIYICINIYIYMY